MRIRVFQGYLQPLLTLVSGKDVVEMVIDDAGRVIVKWEGTLAELAKALKEAKEER